MRSPHDLRGVGPVAPIDVAVQRAAALVNAGRVIAARLTSEQTAGTSLNMKRRHITNLPPRSSTWHRPIGVGQTWVGTTLPRLVPERLICAFIDAMRADGHGVESICEVLCEQGLAVATQLQVLGDLPASGTRASPAAC